MTKHPRYNKNSTKSKESLRVIKNTRKYLLIERKKAANDSFNNSSRYFTGFERQYCDVCSKFLCYGPQKVCKSLLQLLKVNECGKIKNVNRDDEFINSTVPDYQFAEQSCADEYDG